MRSIVYAREAQADLAAIGAYIADQASETTAGRFLERIHRALEDMAHFPGSRPLVPELGADIRRLVVGRYLIFCRFDDTTVFIVRVLHGARNITTTLIRP